VYHEFDEKLLIKTFKKVLRDPYHGFKNWNEREKHIAKSIGSILRQIWGPDNTTDFTSFMNEFPEDPNAEKYEWRIDKKDGE
jgi:hypothetical protein